MGDVIITCSPVARRPPAAAVDGGAGGAARTGGDDLPGLGSGSEVRRPAAAEIRRWQTHGRRKVRAGRVAPEKRPARVDSEQRIPERPRRKGRKDRVCEWRRVGVGMGLGGWAWGR